MTERPPSYIGGWNLARIDQLYGHDVSMGNFKKPNFFHMFLELWHNPVERGRKEEIKGKVIDFYGESDVQGTLRDDYWHLVKRYGDEAIKKGASKYPLVYRGHSLNTVLENKGVVEIVMGIITCPDLSDFSVSTFLMRSR